MRLASFAPILALFRSPRFASAVGVGGLLAGSALGQTLTAEQLVQKSTEVRTVQNSVQTMTMEIVNKAGAIKSKTIETRMKRTASNASMSIVKFLAPEDEAGTAFLSVPGAGDGGEDLRVIWMPALGVENTIKGSQKGGAFAGSDFTYEDLSVGDPAGATHTQVRTETITVAGMAFSCVVIESVPKLESKSSYAKITTWIDTTDSMPRQVFFWNGKGEQVKKMTLEKIQKEGVNAIPMVTVMEDLKKGSRTVVRVQKVRINVPAAELPDSLFTVESLKAGG